MTLAAYVLGIGSLFVYWAMVAYGAWEQAVPYLALSVAWFAVVEARRNRG